MIKNRLFIIPVTALFLSACFGNGGRSGKPNIVTDTLTYTYKNVKQSADDCAGKPDSSCSIANIKYPVFTDQSTLNDTLSREMLRLFDSDPDKDLETQAKNFIKSYDGWRKSHKEVKAHFSLNLNAKVLRQDSSLVTIQIDGSSLAGNKHPVSLTKFINWNTKNNNPVLLDSILINGYKAQLNAIAEKIFRKQENLADTASLARDYFFKGGKFALNNNFVITPIGIRFFYNLYEIKPFNAGTTDVFLPYGNIKQLIRSNSVLRRYIK